MKMQQKTRFLTFSLRFCEGRL